MKVSCIIAIHKNNPFWEEAINSIINQTYSNLEIIIVWNGTDELFYENLLSINSPKIKVLKSDIPQLSFNLNLGVMHSSGELIARMDADDISLPDRIEKQVEYFTNHSVDILGTNYITIDEKNFNKGKSDLPLNNIQIRKALKYRNVICHPSVMFKRSAFIKNNGYLGKKFSEDYDLWIRMARDEQIKFANMELPLLKYRVHSHGQAKGNKIGYAETAGTQLTEFLLSQHLSYFFGTVLTCIKFFIKGK